jgi:ABC-2 type transport system permease protein
VAGAALLAALHVWIGLLAFWLHDVSPVYWVCQKLMFVLGGLMLPLEVYPAAMQRIAAFTPFPALLAGPASFMLAHGGATPAALARDLAFWSVVTAVGLGWTFRRAATDVTINGG